VEADAERAVRVSGGYRCTTYRRALQAGATSLIEPADSFYGDRNAGVKDPVGNLWWIATRTEDLSPQELARRAAAQMK
jgi:PhnB protein